MGVFPADCKNRFIDLNNQIRAKGAQYPFMITNTDSEDKRGTNWWSFLDTERTHSSYLIPSALSDYWVFLSKRSKWACNRSLKRKMKWLFWNGVSKGVTISVWLRKNSNSYRIRHSSSSGSWTSFGKYKGIENTVHMYIVDYRLQSFNTNNCGPFQLYFFLNLFEPLKTSVAARVKPKKLDRKLFSELLNELLSLNSKHNEKMLDDFIPEHYIGFAESDTPVE